jgi:hypothetical protein
VTRWRGDRLKDETVERAEATTYAVAAALGAVLLSVLAYGLGASEIALLVGLAAASVVMLVVYRQLRRKPQP